MKKYFAGLIAALMMAAGLVSFTQSTATAACPYTGCVVTSTDINGVHHVKRHHRQTFNVKVTTAGNGAPRGRVTVKVKLNKGGFSYIDSHKYNGGKEFFTTPKLHKRGKYTITAIFDRKAGSKWTDSDNTAAFRVGRR